MLIILDEKVLRKQSDIEKLYPNCKYLLKGFEDREDDIYGHLYCISDKPETYKEICDKRRELYKEGYDVIVTGSYNKVGMVGVQYEVK